MILEQKAIHLITYPALWNTKVKSSLLTEILKVGLKS